MPLVMGSAMLLAVSGLQRPIHHIAPKSHDRGDIENRHQCSQRDGDADRAHSAPTLPFVLVAVVHARTPPVSGRPYGNPAFDAKRREKREQVEDGKRKKPLGGPIGLASLPLTINAQGVGKEYAAENDRR
jgi:hypothetical protein